MFQIVSIHNIEVLDKSKHIYMWVSTLIRNDTMISKHIVGHFKTLEDLENLENLENLKQLLRQLSVLNILRIDLQL